MSIPRRKSRNPCSCATNLKNVATTRKTPSLRQLSVLNTRLIMLGLGTSANDSSVLVGGIVGSGAGVVCGFGVGDT
ncbi:MAG: hypothetical protein LE179_04965 [Endomicrobium sp.]|nr:hypothetical protein [Endomicrobium sp.]